MKITDNKVAVGMITGAIALNTLAQVPELYHRYSGLESQTRIGESIVRVYDNRTEVSRGNIRLIDFGNDGILDEKVGYFAAARAGIGGGVAQLEVTVEDQRKYSIMRI